MKKKVKAQFGGGRVQGTSASLNISMICLDAAYAGFLSSVARHIQDAKKTDPQVKAAWDRLEVSRNHLGCVYDLQAVAEFSAGLAVA